MDWGDELIAAWNTHDVEAALVALFSPSCRYTDTPFRLTWEGHDGVRTMHKATTTFHPDFSFSRRSGFHDGSGYAREWTTEAKFGDDTVIYSGVSVGTLDSAGLIIENRDYYNPWDIPILN